MGKLRAVDVTVTTDGSGDAVGTFADVHGKFINGYVVALIYTKDDFTDGVDFDVVAANTGLVILDQDNVNASAVWYPRAQVHGTNGVAAVRTSNNEPVTDGRIPICSEAVTWTVANGGAAHTGKLTLVYEEVED